MTITEKPWGTTTALLKTPLIEVHRIEVKPHMRCSMHYHERKWNVFGVVSGKLKVKIHYPAEFFFNTYTVEQGHILAVKPGEWHCFETGADRVIALEIYYPDILGAEDIIRRDVGGCLSQEETDNARISGIVSQGLRQVDPQPQDQRAEGWRWCRDAACYYRESGDAQGRHQPENEERGGPHREDALSKPIGVVWAGASD